MEKIYFQDESKYGGSAEGLFVPETIEELVDYVKEKNIQKETITIQGALTGIAGSGVPVRGLAVKTEKLNMISIQQDEKGWYAYAEAGVTGVQMEHLIARETEDSCFFPVLPTEKTATLGGIAASGAKGIYYRHYGVFKDYIEECRICTAKGEIMDVTRDRQEFTEIFGSEGMLVLFLSFKVRLIPKPRQTWGILFRFRDDISAVRFTGQIEARPYITAIEYMDRNTIDLIETYKKHMAPIASFPDMGEHIQSLIYTEIAGGTEEEVEKEASYLLETYIEAKGDPEDAWAMCTEDEVERLRAYRHAASECVNMEVGKVKGECPEVCKLSLDVSQCLTDREMLLKEYRNRLEHSGIFYCIFGHFGEGGPYVNLVAKDSTQYKEGMCILEEWVKKAYKNQDKVFGEHGVGKLKKEMFKRNAPEAVKKELAQRKEKWDSNGIFNPGNI